MYLIEKYYPVTLAAIITFMVYKFQQYIPDFKIVVPQIAQNTLTVAGTILGFLLTILSLINTINTRRMHFVKTTPGVYNRVMHYLKFAIYASIAAIISSFLFGFLDREKIAHRLMKSFDFALIFIALLSIMLTVRFALIFLQLMADPDPKTNS